MSITNEQRKDSFSVNRLVLHCLQLQCFDQFDGLIQSWWEKEFVDFGQVNTGIKCACHRQKGVGCSMNQNGYRIIRLAKRRYIGRTVFEFFVEIVQSSQRCKSCLMFLLCSCIVPLFGIRWDEIDITNLQTGCNWCITLLFILCYFDVTSFLCCIVGRREKWGKVTARWGFAFNVLLTVDRRHFADIRAQEWVCKWVMYACSSRLPIKASLSSICRSSASVRIIHSMVGTADILQ